MSVWDSLVGQKPVIDMLSRIAQGDPSQITQSWLICGPPGSGRSNMARAFAAALESPDHGMSAEPTRVTQQVLAGTHPDVTVLTTNKVTIGIDQVREIITTSEQMPATAPWRIIIIEDVDRMLERTTNVLLKEIEEPAEHCIWLLCAPSAQDVLPTIRSRTRIVNLAVPSPQAVAGFLTSTTNVEPKVAQRAARLAEGHIGIAKLYATDERVMSDRDELVVGVLNPARASDAVLLAGNLIDNAKAQAENERSQADEDRFVQQDARYLPWPHAKHEVDAEFPLSSGDEQLVRVDDQKSQHEGDDDGEDVHHVAGELNDVCVIGCRDVVHDLLVAHGVERVEHGDGDEERDEVYRVVTQRSPHVAHGEFKQHGMPPRQGRSRPP